MGVFRYLVGGFGDGACVFSSLLPNLEINIRNPFSTMIETDCSLSLL